MLGCTFNLVGVTFGEYEIIRPDESGIIEVSPLPQKMSAAFINFNMEKTLKVYILNPYYVKYMQAWYKPFYNIVVQGSICTSTNLPNVNESGPFLVLNKFDGFIKMLGAARQNFGADQKWLDKAEDKFNKPQDVSNVDNNAIKLQVEDEIPF